MLLQYITKYYIQNITILTWYWDMIRCVLEHLHVCPCWLVLAWPVRSLPWFELCVQLLSDSLVHRTSFGDTFWDEKGNSKTHAHPVTKCPLILFTVIEFPCRLLNPMQANLTCLVSCFPSGFQSPHWTPTVNQIQECNIKIKTDPRNSKDVLNDTGVMSGDFPSARYPPSIAIQFYPDELMLHWCQ